MQKWIVGILGTVIGGLLLAWSLNFFGPNTGRHEGGAGATNESNHDGLDGNMGNDGDQANKSKENPIVVMGPLEDGINLQGYDFDAFGKAAGNEQLCAEMCKNDSKCDAVTYVKSTHVCWMKHGIPPRSVNADMVSSVKKTDSSAAM